MKLQTFFRKDYDRITPLLPFLVLAIFLLQGYTPTHPEIPIFYHSQDSLSEESLRIAVLPFCDESSSQYENHPDINQLYNHILAGLRQLNGCKKNIEWVSKSRINQALVSSNKENENPNSPAVTFCETYGTDSICSQTATNILIMGEFIYDGKDEIAIYYSYENCKGLYESEISYLTEQPIIGSIKNPDQLYRTVAQAIEKDLEHFLECEQPISIEKIFNEGFVLFQRGDSLSTNYASAIQKFEEVLRIFPQHKDAAYYLAMSHFSLDQHTEAARWFSTIPQYKDASLYQTYSELGAKPASWYTTSIKRRKWWNKLDANWKKIFNISVLQLPENTTPSDGHLSTIFEATSVEIINQPLDNLEGLASLSNITQLTCNKNKLASLKGVENLKKLGQLNLNNNKLTNLEGIDKLPVLTRLYVKNNPIQSLRGLENVDKSRFVLFCGYGVPREEINRIKGLGIQIQQ